MTKKIYHLLCAVFACMMLASLSANAQSLVDYSKGFKVTPIVTQSDGINSPVDLDFVPQNEKPYELWIVNREGGQGGSVVIVYAAGQTNQTSEYRKDAFSGHFMAHSTAIAMGDNGNFGTSQEFQPNGQGDIRLFMGPSLWSHDTSIFARKNQNNEDGLLGSHLDMLHESPIGMGIAHDSANVYWYWDGYHSNLVRYDFQIPHEIGGHDHSDGIIWRFTDVDLERIEELPSHMIMDKATKYLYICDPTNKQVRIIDTRDRQRLAPLPVFQEVVNDYSEWRARSLSPLQTPLARPSSIALAGDKLLVGDNTSGDIVVYNVANPAVPVEIAVLKTGQEGLSGIVVGPDGRVWFTNFDAKLVGRLDEQEPSSVSEFVQEHLHVYPNPTSGHAIVEIPSAGELRIVSALGEVVRIIGVEAGTRSIDLRDLSHGQYLIMVRSATGIQSASVLIH